MDGLAAAGGPRAPRLCFQDFACAFLVSRFGPVVCDGARSGTSNKNGDFKFGLLPSNPLQLRNAS